MPNGGTLVLQTMKSQLERDGRAANFVVIRLADTGLGMDEATLRKALDPFFTTKRDGSGLGLSTAYGTIQQHRGELHMTSEPGKGTQIDLLLPEVHASRGFDKDGGLSPTLTGPGRRGVSGIPDDSEPQGPQTSMTRTEGWSPPAVGTACPDSRPGGTLFRSVRNHVKGDLGARHGTARPPPAFRPEGI